MIYLLWLLPIIVGVILYIRSQSTDAIVFSAITLVIVISYTLIHQSIMKNNVTEDTEWWGNYAVSVHYYDDWDEEVSCRHSYDCNCSEDEDGNEECETCYRHSYDVDYHPEYWTIKYNNGIEHEISKNDYIYWCSLWNNKTYKRELNRDYHSNDGDDIACNWDLRPMTSKTIITEHNYENRTQINSSIFRSALVDSLDIKKYKLFDYPKCINGKQDILLGIQTTKLNNTLLEYINGYYGSHKEFKLFICCWFNQFEITAEKQHSYWNNLNKNEFLVCLGLNNDSTIQWCKTYSWMDKPTLSVNTENFFKNNKKLNLYKFANWLPDNITKYWSRKSFKYFKYIRVELRQAEYMKMFIVVLILSLIQFITFGIYERNNRYDRY